MALRQDILQSGTYTAAPADVWACAQLSLAAKAVYQAMLSHLRGDEMTVYPSIARMAKMTGISRQTVMRAIRELESGGLISADRSPGRATRYTLHTLTQAEQTSINLAPVPNTDRYQNGREPVPKWTRTGTKMVPYVLKDKLKDVLPPTPQGGQRENLAVGENIDGNGNGHTSDRVAVAARVKAIGQAHIEATGHPMPERWGRQITTEHRRGDRTALALVDADMIRAARRLFDSRPGLEAFGFGTVLLAVTELRHASQRRKTKAAQAAAAEAVKAAEEQARAADSRRRLEAFRQLPEPVRQEYLTEAATGFGSKTMRRRPDVMEGVAACAAERAGKFPVAAVLEVSL